MSGNFSLPRPLWPVPLAASVLVIVLALSVPGSSAGPEQDPDCQEDERDSRIIKRLRDQKGAGGQAAARPGKRRDDPRAAAAFLRRLRGTPKGDDRQIAVPRAIAHVAQMRDAVAKGTNVPASVMAVLLARGIPVARVAGVPVGPLPATSAEAEKLPREDLLDKAFVPAKRLGQLRTLNLPLRSSAALGGAGWLGPSNIGGRTRSLLIHPTNPQTMWLGAVSGGIFRSRDGGGSWEPYKQFLASLDVSCMTLDPGNPDVLYAGTGEGIYFAEEMRGAGIFRSRNGGEDWEQLPGSRDHPAFGYVNRLGLAARGKTLLAATNDGLFYGDSDGKKFTRAQVLTGGGGLEPFGAKVLDLRCDPQDPQGLRGVAGGVNGKAWFSRDGGRTWKAAQGLPTPGGTFGRVELTYAAAGSKFVYASVDDLAYRMCEGSTRYDYYGQVFLSQDGGETYALRGKPGHLVNQGWHANCIWAGDPQDPNLVVVGGLDLHRSTDGGRCFVVISDWKQAPTSPHADHHVILSHPSFGNNQTVFFGNDGGIYVADDVRRVQAGQGWRALNNGLGITQFFGAAINPTTGQVMAGSQDNGTRVYTKPRFPPAPHQGIDDWFDYGLDGDPYSGDGGNCAADAKKGWFYSEYTFLQIHRSDGKSGYRSIDRTLCDSRSEDLALFVAPFVLAPDDPAVMFAGGARLWRCADVRADKPVFKKVKEFLLQGGNEDRPVLTRISAIAVAPGKPQVVWVGHEINWNDSGSSGAVFRTGDVTAAKPVWERQGKDRLPGRHCTRIVLDPRNRQTVYALFGGYSRENLWSTTNGGTTWAPVGSTGTRGLPPAPAFDLAIHPDDSKVMLVGTEMGLFLSSDGGKTWAPTSLQPTNCTVYQLVWSGKQLYVVTHGRGLFTLDMTLATSPGANRQGFPARPAPRALRP